MNRLPATPSTGQQRRELNYVDVHGSLRLTFRFIPLFISRSVLSSVHLIQASGAETLCLHGHTKQREQDIRSTGGSIVSSSVSCRMSLYKQTSSWTDMRTFVCGVVLYSGLKFGAVAVGNVSGELRTTERSVWEGSVSIDWGQKGDTLCLTIIIFRNTLTNSLSCCRTPIITGRNYTESPWLSFCF